PTPLAQLLGSVETVTCSGMVYATTGTSPTITVQLEHSPDGARWMSEQGTAELNAFPLTSGSDNFFFCVSTFASALSHVRLRIALGGTTPTGVVQIWLAGRSPARY